MQDLVAGQIDLLFDTPRNSLPLARAGSIRAYAVTGDMRLTVAPDIPTFAEMGMPVMSYSEWVDLFAPAGVSSDIIKKLNEVRANALAAGRRQRADPAGGQGGFRVGPDSEAPAGRR
jgi:tripartite-type tricarboxylate transporter receptor subunit TctC